MVLPFCPYLSLIKPRTVYLRALALVASRTQCASSACRILYIYIHFRCSWYVFLCCTLNPCSLSYLNMTPGRFLHLNHLGSGDCILEDLWDALLYIETCSSVCKNSKGFKLLVLCCLVPTSCDNMTVIPLQALT